jgi:hypothetical protein
MSNDPNVLSVPQASTYAGVSPDRLRWRIKNDAAFRDAVVIDMPGPIKISLPRLLRHLHGNDWRSTVFSTVSDNLAH